MLVVCYFMMSATPLCARCDTKCRWQTQLCAVRTDRCISARWEQTRCQRTTPAMGPTFHEKSSQTLRASSITGEILQSSVFVYVVDSSLFWI